MEDMNIDESSQDFVPTIGKCALNEEFSIRTLSTELGSISECWSVASNDIGEDFFVTGHCSDIFEDYEVYPAIIGTGHYGCVRECLHRKSGQLCAVKTIEKSKIGRLDHIQREVEILRTVGHHGVMEMMDSYEDSEYVHIVMTKYSGGELFDRIIEKTTDHGCFSEREAARIVKYILEAVDYLHSMDIVHRDIKPENVMFESNEDGAHVKLIDFGLSRKHRIDDPEMSNKVGTAYYMSPDVINGKYDRSCDIWSVGVVAYILLCGYPPFNGSTDSDICNMIQFGSVDFSQNIWGGFSDAAKDFVSNLLCRDSRRIRTAEAALQHPWISGCTN